MERKLFRKLGAGLLAAAIACSAVPGISAAAADAAVNYDIWLAGTRVTSANAADILGDGKFSFDPASDTLTLNGDYTVTSYTEFIRNKIDGLTIRVASDSVINAYATEYYHDDGIVSEGYSLTITGEGRLTVNASQYEDPIHVEDGGILTIQDADLEVSGWSGLSGLADGALRIINSTVHAVGYNGAVDYFPEGITLENCCIAEPAGAFISGEYIKNPDGSKAKEITILPWNCDLKIFGTKVTPENTGDILGNGVFAYLPATNTLHIHGDYTSKNNRDFIENNNDGLTVNTTADSVITCNASGIYSLYHDLSMTGEGKLTINAGSNSYGIFIEESTLTIRNTNLDVKAGVAVRGYADASEGYALNKLNIINSAVHLKSTGATTALAGFSGGIALNECTVSFPENGYVEGGKITSDSITNPSEVTILPPEKYDLWIAGTQVTKLNAADILGDGNLSYDAGVNMLTLNGDYEIPANTDAYFILNRIDNLNVRVASATSLTSVCDTVYSDHHNMKITGSSKLTIKTNGCGIYTPGCTLTVDNANLDITGHSGIRGELQNDRLIVANSRIRANGLEGAVCGFGNGILLDNCIIAEPEDAMMQTGGIRNADGTVLNGLTIVPTEYYLHITEKQVTYFNRNDILGDGKFSFDPLTLTLYVRGKTTISSYISCIDNRTDGLTVCIASDTRITSEYPFLSTCCNTVITGPGKLEIDTHNQNCIVSQNGDLTIRDANLELRGNTGILMNGGGKLDIINSAIYTRAYLSGIRFTPDRITLEKCHIAVPDDAVISDGDIRYADGRIATEFEIVPNAVPEITAQPANQTKTIGATAKFSVTAEGEGLTYQWQCDSGKGFQDSNFITAKTAELRVPVTAARDGYKYRCIVKNAEGESIISSAATLKVKPSVTAQPVNVTKAIGATAKFTVTASGAGTLSYQWQNYTSSGWKDSGLATAKTAELCVPVTAARDGYKYRCIVTSSNGTKATSETVTLKVKPAITAQPKNYSGAAGTTAKFTVTASGAGTLSYQWQNYTSSGWKDSGLATAKTAELRVPVTAARNGYKYRCIVTSSNGTKTTSNAATLTVQ